MSIVPAHGAHAGVTGLFLPEDNAEKSSLYIERSSFTACFSLKRPGKNPKVTYWHTLKCRVLHSNRAFPYTIFFFTCTHHTFCGLITCEKTYTEMRKKIHFIYLLSHRWQITICIDQQSQVFYILVVRLFQLRCSKDQFPKLTRLALCLPRWTCRQEQPSTE